MKPGPSPIPTRVVRAAGAVTWRFIGEGGAPVPGMPIAADDIEVLVVHRPRYKDWSWPKGKTEHNEPIIAAAVREVEEETGVVVDLHAPLTTQRYRLGTGQTKEVYYWVGTPTPHETYRRARVPVERAPMREIDRAKWMPTAKAMKLLTRRGDRRLLEELLVRASAGTLVTSTIVMLRHAKAVSRGSWEERHPAGTLTTEDLESTRPLTRLGGRQALDVVDLLSAFGVNEVLTSPWARCRNTVMPYAAVASLPIEDVPELTESAVDRDSKAAKALMKQLVLHPSGAVAICVHRPTIPTLMEPLQRVAAPNQIADFPSESPWLSTAQMLVAHLAHPADPAAVAEAAKPTKPNPAMVFGGGKPKKAAPPEPGEPVLMGVELHETYTRLNVPG